MTQSETAHDAPLLIEIGTEELPPDSLRELGESFARGIADELKQAGFAEGQAQAFYTPRRLAVRLDKVSARLPDRQAIRKGPPLAQAYAADGSYTEAAAGFAKSCGVEVKDLQASETEQRIWCEVTEVGDRLEDVLSAMLERVAAALPVRRKMRWGDRTDEFVRPVRWLCVIHGSQVLACQLFGIAATNASRLHRAYHARPVAIPSAEAYLATLASGKVIADFSRRRAAIAESLKALTDAEIVMEDADLDRAASLVEWPQAIKASFDAHFLGLPEEVVMHTLKHALGAFPVRDAAGALLPEFAVVVNLESTAVDVVRAGYERVVRPRLSDIEFFFQRDRATALARHCEALDGVVFQKQLGTLSDKTVRIGQLGESIADACKTDRTALSRAAALCKCDLATEVVAECPELQGTMGRYYAAADGEPQAVADAIAEHYLPRYGGDELPASPAGVALALADKVDTLTGIFSIGRKPTANKDPFALRRAALGVIRILTECEIPIHLRSLIRTGLALHQAADDKQCENDVFAFFQERMKRYYLDKAYAADCVNAVMAAWGDDPDDFRRRLEAVESFRKMPEAENLAILSKRIRNILKKAVTENSFAANGFTADGFTESAERQLWDAVSRCDAAMARLLAKSFYLEAMREIAKLREPADKFFDDVMVMSENAEERSRRLGLLDYLNGLFMRVADFSKLNVAASGAE